jgi:hypothetical protein
MTQDTAAKSVAGSSSSPRRSRGPFFARLRGAAFARLERWLGVKVVVIYKRPLLAEFNRSMTLDASYSLRELTEPDLLAYVGDPVLGFTRDFLSNAFASGDTCFGILHNDRLVAYRWYAFSGATPCESGLTMTYAFPGRVYSYKSLTDPRYRGRRLQNYLMQRVDPLLIQRGYDHTIGYVGLYNTSSLRHLTRARDLTYTGFIAYTTFLRRNLVVATPGVRRQGIAMVSP